MEDPGLAEKFEVTCPHCGRAFKAERLDNASGRPGGFKCAHCRLFVPVERADVVGEAELGSA